MGSNTGPCGRPMGPQCGPHLAPRGVPLVATQDGDHRVIMTQVARTPRGTLQPGASCSQLQPVAARAGDTSPHREGPDSGVPGRNFRPTIPAAYLRESWHFSISYRHRSNPTPQTFAPDRTDCHAEASPAPTVRNPLDVSDSAACVLIAPSHSASALKRSTIASAETGSPPGN